MQPAASLKQQIEQTLQQLPERPSRNQLVDAAESLNSWKLDHGIESLWESPPLMVTATLDDGWGHGLAVIHLYAEVAGLRLIPLGLLQPPETVIAACRQHRPAILGLTVLQFDTEDDLVRIRNQIPADTRIVAGGPLFGADPELAERAGIDIVAKNATAFMTYLLELSRH